MNIKKIVVHCSDTPNGREHTAEDIHRWHKERGWDGIGYHYVIRINGTVDAGRPMYWQGAHVSGNNKDSIGICLIGRDEYAVKQLDALYWLIYKIKKEFPEAEVFGHCDLDSKKTCPNFDVKEWLSKFWG